MNYSLFETYQHKQAMSSITIDVADISARINSDDDSLLKAARLRYQQFISSNENVDLDLDVHISPGYQFSNPNGNGKFFNKQIINENKNIVYSNRFAGYVDKPTNQGKLICAEIDAPSWLEHFLRIAYSWMALDRDGLLFHGAGLINGNQGYIFFGPSESGKTTVTCLSPQCTVLGDDLIMLRKVNGYFTVYASPFNVRTEQIRLTNDQAHIQGFYRLRQDRKTFIKEMNPAKAVSELLSSAPLIDQNYPGSLKALDLCHQIVQQIPCFDLHFTRDDSFWSCINGNS